MKNPGPRLTLTGYSGLGDFIARSERLPHRDPAAQMVRSAEPNDRGCGFAIFITTVPAFLNAGFAH